MKIIIDNSAEDRTVFYLNVKNSWLKEEKKTAGKTPLLALLESVLKKHKTPLNKLSGIAVVVGQGRFTAARIAVTVANSLAYALGIPVAGIVRIDFAEAGRKLSAAAPGKYLSATYSGEAHIGGKRQPPKTTV